MHSPKNKKLLVRDKSYFFKKSYKKPTGDNGICSLHFVSECILYSNISSFFIVKSQNAKQGHI